jgi:glutamate-1-semialdehyde 2,1-aminomutase
MTDTAVTLDRARIRRRLEDEEQRFAATHPRSYALAERARGSLLGGVPMHWMSRWAGRFPVFADHASGAWLTDVDGHRYLDLCLGDTGAMTGHSPPAVVAAVEAQAVRGFTFMLPTEDAVWVGEELARRFGLPYWQFALTATDANRFAIRLARHITRRQKILVFNWCYHGTVDEAFATLRDGRTTARTGNVGPPVDPFETTRVVEFNDPVALEAALAPGDVACVLAEPALTNIGIVLPDPGFHAAVRDITRRTGTLLIIDETHTISAGPRGYTGANGLEPDMLTLGKAVAGGVPGAVYGFTADVAARIAAATERDTIDTAGVGGTLAGNPLATAAMRATLSAVLTEDAFARTIPLAERWTAGVARAIADFALPWTVQRLGCRAEYWFRSVPPRTGAEAAASADPELERYMHLAALNRGILLTPFHNMALLSPSVTEADVDRHTEVFRDSVASL